MHPSGVSRSVSSQTPEKDRPPEGLRPSFAEMGSEAPRFGRRLPGGTLTKYKWNRVVSEVGPKGTGTFPLSPYKNRVIGTRMESEGLVETLTPETRYEKGLLIQTFRRRTWSFDVRDHPRHGYLV